MISIFGMAIRDEVKKSTYYSVKNSARAKRSNNHFQACLCIDWSKRISLEESTRVLVYNPRPRFEPFWKTWNSVFSTLSNSLDLLARFRIIIPVYLWVDWRGDFANLSIEDIDLVKVTSSLAREDGVIVVYKELVGFLLATWRVCIAPCLIYKVVCHRLLAWQPGKRRGDHTNASIEREVRLKKKVKSWKCHKKNTNIFLKAHVSTS